MCTPRKRFRPAQVMPKPTGAMPVVYGVEPAYPSMAGLQITAGRFFTDEESARAAALCVLGEAARQGLFGGADPIDRFVKVGGQWFRVIGIAAPQAVAQGEVAACRHRTATT